MTGLLTSAVPAPAAARDALTALAGAERGADAVDLLERYAAMLAGAGVQRGLLGPREAPRLWERHLCNSAALIELLTPGQVVVDLGSGAGLPGVVLAALRPDVTVVLVEPLLRRSDFLHEVVQELGLRTTVVRRARAEELAGVLLADVVTARAVAPLDRLAGWALPLLHPGGRLLALKGERADAELAAAGSALTAAGAASSEILDIGADVTAARVVAVTAGRQSAGSRSTGSRSTGTRPAASGAGRAARGRPAPAGTTR